MSNNEAEIQAAQELIESGVIKQVIGIGLDCYFAKLDERKARELGAAGRTFELDEAYEKLEPGVLMMVGKNGKLQQAIMPPVLELLKTSKVGEMFQLEEGGLAPGRNFILKFEKVTHEARTYHFHTPLVVACMAFRKLTMWVPNTGVALIDNDPRYYILHPNTADIEVNKFYSARLVEIAKWDWENLQGASPLVREAEIEGTG